MKKSLGRAFVTVEQLETIIVEIEAMLNDRPLTYVSSDFANPEPLTPSHLLYGRRIRSIPHPLDNPEELDDPDYLDADNMRKRVDKQTHFIEQFWTRWKRGYLTSLREFNKISGHNKQAIKLGDVVIVLDDKPRMQWRIAVVEKLITGKDNLARAAHIRIETYKTTHPIVKLYPLEVSSEDDVSQAVTDNTSDESTQHMKDTQAPSNDTTSSGTRPRRNAAAKALQKIYKWATILGRTPEDVGN